MMEKTMMKGFCHSKALFNETSKKKEGRTVLKMNPLPTYALFIHN